MNYTFRKTIREPKARDKLIREYDNAYSFTLGFTKMRIYLSIFSWWSYDDILYENGNPRDIFDSKIYLELASNLSHALGVATNKNYVY